MIKFMSLSSGSCGNCYYLGTENGGIIIDAGVSLRRLKKVLQEYDMDMDAFSAVLVTHDHLDHIRHLGSFCKRLHKPVYTTSVIHHALARHTFTAPTIAPCRRILAADQWNEVAGMKVDGSLTLSENIADLGAMTCITSILSGDKDGLAQFFSQLAYIWASEETIAYQMYLLSNDTHAPNKVRVNAVLSSNDAFYEVYDIEETDGMYVAPEYRVGVWK